MSTRMKETALSLKEQLAGSCAGWYRRVRAERHAIIRRHRAPAIVLANAKGETLDVGTLLKKGAVIVTFDRGLYCNLELKAFQEILPETAAAGASLVAISPEKPDDTLSTAEKNATTFEVPNDVGRRVGRALSLVYDFTDELKSAYRGFGLEIPARNGAPREWALPVLATYVIDQDGETIYAHTDVDYRDRASIRPAGHPPAFTTPKEIRGKMKCDQLNGSMDLSSLFLRAPLQWGRLMPEILRTLPSTKASR